MISSNRMFEDEDEEGEVFVIFVVLSGRTDNDTTQTPACPAAE